MTLGGGAGSGWARGPGPGRPPPARALPPAVFSAPRSACRRLFSSPPPPRLSLVPCSLGESPTTQL